MMRADMKHVIIDRPRIGGSGGKSRPAKGSKRRWQRIPLEDHPKTESNAPKRLYASDCKSLNEHLAPLRRWLRSNCGRLWDEVHSEICANLRIDNATQAHVRDHAEKYVLTGTRLIDGRICDSKGTPLNSGWRWPTFYVDPRNGTLQQAAPGSRKRRLPKAKDYIEGKDEWHQYRLLTGIWYEIELAPLPPGIAVHDVLLQPAKAFRAHRLHIPVFHDQACRLYGRAVYATSKRQLGKHEIRRLRLWDSALDKDAVTFT
jgi:hypothetical protein